MFHLRAPIRERNRVCFSYRNCAATVTSRITTCQTNGNNHGMCEKNCKTMKLYNEYKKRVHIYIYGLVCFSEVVVNDLVYTRKCVYIWCTV